MRCYSHLSDDDREQIGLARTLGHSIGAIAQAIGRPKSTIWRELSRISCRADATRRFTPPGPINCAGEGRLRRWLPRRIDIDQVSDEEIQHIVITANLTPWASLASGGHRKSGRLFSCKRLPLRPGSRPARGLWLRLDASIGRRKHWRTTVGVITWVACLATMLENSLCVASSLDPTSVEAPSEGLTVRSDRPARAATVW
jgi:Helix-turn-helix domain